MKVVNANWEIKNLGEKTLEFTFESEDFLKKPVEVYNQIENFRMENLSEYVVVKIRTGNPDFGNELCKNGFIHIETQIHLKAIAEDVRPLLNEYANLFEDTEIKKISDLDEMKYIQSKILEGVFTNDRISLDKNFGVKVANQRYANWLGDEFNRGSSVYQIFVGDKKVGFIVRRYEKKSVRALLAGLFKEYKNLKIGGNVYYIGLANDLNSGYTKFYADVSSNNLDPLRLQQLFGYKVHDFSEVYVNHYSY